MPQAATEIRPQTGLQEAALASTADIAILGGSAGCGKTFVLLLEPLRYVDLPAFGAVVFRRESPEITNQGGLWDESSRLYREFGAESNAARLEWTFPSGAKVRFSHLQREEDKFAWKGAQVPLIEFDQLEMFTAGQFWYLVSRNRDPAGRVRSFIRASCNPVPEDDPVGGWLHRLISWWLDAQTGLPRDDRAGVLRWFVRGGEDQLAWYPSREAALYAHPERSEHEVLSMTFIPGRLETDNPAMMRADPGYRGRLMALPLVERERLLGGNWNIRPTAGSVFNRSWFILTDAVPVECRGVRYWDLAATEGGGDWTAGVKMFRSALGVYYVEHVIRGQWSAHHRNRVIRQTAESDGLEVMIWVPQDPGSGGKEAAEILLRELAGFIVRAETVTGDKVTRAGPFASQAEAENVKLVRGAWNEEYLAELHGFPEGGHDDQVDASSGAFNKLALSSGAPTISVLGQSAPVAPKRVFLRG